ncbi:MAG: hypothetical protein ACI9XB_000700 [Gammaproteobacteria bacterium]|jgi:hypothetical protein
MCREETLAVAKQSLVYKNTPWNATYDLTVINVKSLLTTLIGNAQHNSTL